MFSAKFSAVTLIIVTISILYARCQLQYQNDCPFGWTRCGNICFFTSSKENQVPWRMATDECQSVRNDSKLLILDNREKDENIRSCLQQNSTIAEVLWIDGIFNPKQKRWVFGETAQPLQYQAFSRKQPQDDSEWRCIALNKQVLYRWSSIDCFSNRPFICEIISN